MNCCDASSKYFYRATLFTRIRIHATNISIFNDIEYILCAFTFLPNLYSEAQSLCSTTHLIDIYFCTGLRWLISRQLSFDLDSAGTFLYSYYSWWLCW